MYKWLGETIFSLKMRQDKYEFQSAASEGRILNSIMD